MRYWKKILFIIFIVFFCTNIYSQQICVAPNPIAHIILIPAGIATLDGQPLPNGSIISAVFNSGDSLKCGGQIVWQNKSIILQVYGKSSDGDEGFLSNEPLKFRVILPNGCTIEDDLIFTSFQDIANNQNPGFQNFGINRLEKFNASSPKFNIVLKDKDTLNCNKNQIELKPSIDIVGAKFLWSNDSLGVLSRNSNLKVDLEGIYKLTVNLKGCIQIKTVEVIDLRKDLSVIISPVSTKICQGETAKIEVITSIKNAVINWSNGSKSNFIEVSKSGIYSVVVKSPSGCTFEKQAELVVNTKPNFDLGENKNLCTGEYIALAMPQNSSFSYKWSTGDTISNITIKKSGLYRAKLTDSNKCIAEDSININFVDSSQVNLPIKLNFCIGTSIVLDPKSNGKKFHWNTGDTTATIRVNKGGIYEINVSNSIGCKKNAKIEVISLSAPDRILPHQLFKCENERVSIDAGIGSTTYKWNTGETTQIINPIKSALYTVTITNEEGCSSIDSSDIHFLSKPSIELGPNQDLCYGQIAKLSVKDSINYNYSWNTQEKSPSINVTRTGLYTINVTNKANCLTRDSIYITFKAPAISDLPTSLSTCEIDTKKLVAGPIEQDYAWNTGERTNAIVPNKSGVYKVLITNKLGCSTLDSLSVTVSPNPKIIIPKTLTLCPEKTISLDVSKAGNLFSWSNGAKTGKIEVSKAGVYTVSVTNAEGCSSADSVAITAAIKPSRLWPKPFNSCEGKTIIVDGSNLGQPLSWSTGEKTPSIQIKKSGLYTISYTDAAGCTTLDSLRAIFYNNPPSIKLPDLRACTGQSQTVDVRNFGKTYSWNTGSQEGIITIKDEGLYRVTVTNEFGCNAVDSVRLFLWPNPIVKLTPSYTICPGEPLGLDARNFGTKFKWSTGATTGLITTTTAGLYQVTVTDQNGCIGQGGTQVNILNYPKATIDQSNPFLCLGDSLVLTGNGDSPWRWLDPDKSSNLLAANKIRVKPVSTTKYGYVVENRCGLDTAYATVNVRKVKGSAGRDTAILAGRKIQLKATGGKSYQWITPKFQLSNEKIANPEVSPSDSTYFIVVIQDENNCRLRDTINIGVYSDITELIKPINLFTPNGDGKNDVLKFNSLDLFKSNKLTVFNRWGVIVYQKSGYQNDWGGTYDGSLLPAGIYFYVLEVDDAVLKNALTLIHN